MVKNHKLFTDGGSRGNPGPAAYGCALYDEFGKLIDIDAKYIGEKTNNQAEYQGIIAGLKLARKSGVNNILCYLDSELIVKQIKGEYKVKNSNIKPLFKELVDLINEFESFEFTHVYRAENKVADKLVNIILNVEKTK